MDFCHFWWFLLLNYSSEWCVRLAVTDNCFERCTRMYVKGPRFEYLEQQKCASSYWEMLNILEEKIPHYFTFRQWHCSNGRICQMAELFKWPDCHEFRIQTWEELVGQQILCAVIAPVSGKIIILLLWIHLNSTYDVTVLTIYWCTKRK